MNILLFVLGAAAVYFLQMLLCGLLWDRGLRASVAFSEKQVREGDAVLLTAAVENRKRLPLVTLKVNVALDRGLEFQDQSNLAISDKNYRSEIFSLHGYERVERSLPLFCARRNAARARTVGTNHCIKADGKTRW